ncbi:hypothetical protein OQA88_1339 [Cercophora sp. LCS_1]
MSGPIAGNLLARLLPRLGFHWKQGQGSPRIMRNDARDALIQRALIDINGPEQMLKKKEARELLTNAVTTVATLAADSEHGMAPGEDILDFLGRAQQYTKFAGTIEEDVWIELIYQLVSARERYEEEVPAARRAGDRELLTALAHAIDQLVAVVGSRWDRFSLEFFVFPGLMGESADYSDSEEEEDDEDKMEEGGEEMEKEEEKDEREELAARVEDMVLHDADGDIEMGE